MGEGHSSPVVAGGRVFIFTRVGEDEVVSALDLATGKPAWERRYPAPYTMNSAATSHGKGPKSTPLVSDGRLFTLGHLGHPVLPRRRDRAHRVAEGVLPAVQDHLARSTAPRRRRSSKAAS